MGSAAWGSRPSLSTRSSARSTARGSSTAAFGPPLGESAGAGSGSPRPSAAASRCRRSPSTGSGTCTSSKDGHHRVSVARAMGRKEIDAYVTEVVTEVDPSGGLRLADLPLKSHQRVFFERVPLPPEARERIQLSDPWDYATLAEGVEAWGFRAIQREGRVHDPRAGRRGVVPRGLRADRRHPARGGTARKTAARPRPTSGWSASATGCCAPTTGTRACSSGWRASFASRSSDWPPGCGRSTDRRSGACSSRATARPLGRG